MRIIAVSNLKGGIGKTTTCVNVSAFLAKYHNKRVLIVDLDHQGHATDGLGVDSSKLEYTIADLICADPNNQLKASDVIIPTKVEGLDIIASDLSLALADIKLAAAYGREYRLRKVLKPIQDNYDYIFIDCAPSFSTLTINAFTTASEIMVPVHPKYYCMKGLDGFMEAVKFVNSQLSQDISHKVEVAHILLTFFDTRPKMAIKVLKTLSDIFGDKVLKTKIPVNTKLDEAQSYGVPIFDYDSKCTGHIAYEQLTKELLERHSL